MVNASDHHICSILVYRNCTIFGFVYVWLLMCSSCCLSFDRVYIHEMFMVRLIPSGSKTTSAACTYMIWAKHSHHRTKLQPNPFAILHVFAVVPTWQTNLYTHLSYIMSVSTYSMHLHIRSWYELFLHPSCFQIDRLYPHISLDFRFFWIK